MSTRNQSASEPTVKASTVSVEVLPVDSRPEGNGQEVTLMDLIIKLNMENAAFADGPRSQEVKRIILQALRGKITTGEAGDGKLQDSNGNTCGTWEVR